MKKAVLTDGARKWSLRIGALGVIVAGLWMLLRPREPVKVLAPVYQYPGKGVPVQVAREKLLKVGRCIQIYRKEKGFLPVNERLSPEDAGLPLSMMELARQGHKWSLPNGMEDFRFEQEAYDEALRPPSMMHMKLLTIPPVKDDGWAERGERRPILMVDYVVDETTYRNTQNEGFQVLILRLDGTVDNALYKRRDPHFIIKQ